MLIFSKPLQFEINRKILIKNTLKYHLTLVRRAHTNQSEFQGCVEKELFTASENVTWSHSSGKHYGDFLAK